MVSDHDHAAAERRDAARALLRYPVLTAGEHAEDLARVRRHAPSLKGLFATLLGYPLVVESSFARLIKAPLTDDAPARPVRRGAGSEFSPRTYAYLSLLGAALLAPEVGEQVLASTLVEQLRADAATAGLVLADSHAEARHLVGAFNLLAAWGVVEETEGSISAWGDRQEEALISINRQMLPHLLARTLAGFDTPQQLLEASSGLVEQPRRSLRRKLVENPLVRREDLTDAERDVLSRERTELSRVLEENFGLTLEVRAEGALAYDTDGELTDVAFPGSGTVRWAALLLLDALIAANEPKAGHTFEVDGMRLPGLLCRWTQVEQVLRELADRHEKAWSREYVFELDRLQAGVTDLLAGLGLAEGYPDGLAVHPAAARYRPTVDTAPTKTRARRRLDPDDPPPGSTESLFDTPAAEDR
jgi:uncharacterized protein (TIGR02678 family)